MDRVEVIRYTFRLLGLLEAGAPCAPYSSPTLQFSYAPLNVRKIRYFR